MFQQDGATCHTSKKTISAIDEIGLSVIAPNIWPPNSPDLSPLDYFFWNEVENRLKSKNYHNRKELVEKIKETIQEIPIKMIQGSIDNFRSRVYAVEKNEGRLILNKYS